ncbi:MAG TPA: ATP-binding protein, partial [Candidatus Omnitrophota bacterium]|nr:ATP-binding protein [Candidatus Omnitrophota bacterium]
MRFVSIRLKTSVIYTAVLFVILSVYSAILFNTIRHNLYREIDNVLRVKTQAIADIINTYSQVGQGGDQMYMVVDGNTIYFNNRLYSDMEKKAIRTLWTSKTKETSLKDDYVNFLNAKGHSIVTSGNFTDKVKKLFEEKIPFSRNKIVYTTIFSEGYNMRVISCPFLLRGRTQYIIQVGTAVDSVNNILSNLTVFIGVSIFFILLFTSFMGRLLTGRILRPVKAITTIANNISQEDLHVRIKEEASDEEIKYLIDSLNKMIARLEVSFRNVDEFSINVAHELKTSLTIIKGEQELALIQERDIDEYKRVLGVSSEEIDRLIRIINDLLLLAKLDYKMDILKFDNIGMTAFMREVCEQAEILANQRKIKMTLDVPSTEVLVRADKIHLRRVFFNLISNSVKFTPKGGNIDLSLRVSGKRVYVSVSDNGEGIAPENIDKIFDKFFRVRKDDKGAEGNGLGLTLVLSIVKAHGGDIKVSSEPGKGSVFTVIL